MKRNNIKTIRFVIQFSLVFLLASGPYIKLSAQEVPPDIHVTEIITPQLASSLQHRVEDASLQGYYVDFYVETDITSFNILSVPMLRKRVQEILILARAKSETREGNDEVGEYTAGEYRVSADSAVDLLSRPVQLAGDVAGQVADNIGETLSGSSSTVADRYQEPYKELDDPVAAMHKRNIASQWGLDVYSMNPSVQSFLNETARERSAGRISAGSPILNRQVIKPLKVENTGLENELRFLLKNNSLDELQEYNSTQLHKLNINENIVEKLISSKIISPSYKTRIIQYIKLLDGVRNLNAFFELIVTASSEVDIISYELAVMSLVYYHQRIEPLRQLHHSEGVLQAITNKNTMLTLLTGDIVYWSDELAAKVELLYQHANASGFSAWEILASGDITQNATTELEQRDFKVTEKFIY